MYSSFIPKRVIQWREFTVVFNAVLCKFINSRLPWAGSHVWLLFALFGAKMHFVIPSVLRSPTERVFLDQSVGSSSPHISCYEIAWHPTQTQHKTDLSKSWERKLCGKEAYLKVWRLNLGSFFNSLCCHRSVSFRPYCIMQIEVSLKRFTINLKRQFNSTHSFQEPLKSRAQAETWKLIFQWIDCTLDPALIHRERSCNHTFRDPTVSIRCG